MTTPARRRHTGLLTLTIGAALVAFVLIWQSGAAEPSVAARDAPAAPAPASANATDDDGGRHHAGVGMERGRRPPAGTPKPGISLSPAYATAQAEALFSWRTQLDQQIAPCMPPGSLPSMRTVEFWFVFDETQSDETTQRFNVAEVDPGPEADDELAACLRGAVGMSIDVMFEAAAGGYADFTEWVPLV